jgi:o-succinylbenzoate synthase
MKVSFKKHSLNFILPGGTSRGVLKTKDSWIIKIADENVVGYGEISIIPGLSIDDPSQIENLLNKIIPEIENGKIDFTELINSFPAVHFAIEMALKDFQMGGKGVLFQNAFTSGETGIKMNGLVWMNPIEVMKLEAERKFADGFHCLKFKIGSYDFTDEFELLKYFRNKYGSDLEIRVDANGAYHEKNVFDVMEKLAELKIHSIEQPIKPRQYSLMNKICRECAVPVALDEELIGVKMKDAISLLDEIKPAYLILKPSLLGGFQLSDFWFMLAKERNIDWWATSALESNIGLNAIAQWVAEFNLDLPQGLGTGSLYDNNFASALEIRKDELWMVKDKKRENPF